MKEKLRITNDDRDWCPKFIEIPASLFCVALVLTGVLAPKIFECGPFSFSAAIIIFPICCILGDTMTEVYGFNRTRRIIWMGLVCELLLVAMTAIAVKLPPHDDRIHAAFSTVFGHTPRIVFASFTAYFLNEMVNSLIMSKMKLVQGTKGFGLRAMTSTFVAQLVDSVVFFVIAFAGIVANPVLINLILSSWAAKTLYELLVLPLTALAVRKLKNLEGVEHFDRQKLMLVGRLD